MSESPAPEVSVIIVSFNTREHLRRCLSSLFGSTSKVSYEVIVVDNASSDGSAELVEQSYPTVRLVKLSRNVGFARACNAGAAKACGAHIMLLNPDTVVIGETVYELSEALRRRPQAGIVGGRTLHEDGRLNPTSCWGLPSLWSMFCFATGLTTVFSGNRLLDPESLGPWQRDTERGVGVVTGCLLLCRGDLWRALDGFDETYFMYGEDVDLSLRARAMGAQPFITPNAVVVHTGGAATATTAAKTVMVMRGKVTFMRRRWPTWRARVGVALLIIGTGLRAAAAAAGLPVRGAAKENWNARNQWRAGWECY